MDLGKRVKELRIRKRKSQELLAEDAGLSIRTIQRIEKGETTPNGDTLHKLSEALNVSQDVLMNGTDIEDIDFLKKMNLSALTFVLFPLLGILVPAIMWISKKDKIKDVDQIAKKIINFEITWTILFFIIPIFIKPLLFGFIEPFLNLFINSSFLSLGYDHWTDAIIIWMIMYLVNIIYIIFNTFRIHDGKKIKYSPSFGFFKI